MPKGKGYASKAQQGWAHATHQEFADRWDKETKKRRKGGFKTLPTRKSGGSQAGRKRKGKS